MAGIGGGAFALDELSQLVRQRMRDRLAAEKQAESIRQFNVGASERARAHTLQLQERQDALRQAAQQREDAATQNFAAGSTPPMDISGSPMVGRLQSRGLGGFIQTAPEQQAAEGAGVLQTPPGAPAPQLYQPEQQQFTGGAAYQQARVAAQERAQQAQEAERAKIDAGTAAAATAQSNKEDLMRLAASLRPPKAGPQPHFTVQPEFDQTGKPTGRQFRVNSLTGEVSLAQTPEGGARTKPGAQNATLDTRLASAKAVVQTGNDIVSDLKANPQAGPALGRFNTLRDFIGNPPPEYAALAGKIESYALANMGVHGMRSAQGAEQIKKVLDQHHTPESLIATINGLNGFANHLLENEGKSVGAPAATPSGGGSFRVVGVR